MAVEKRTCAFLDDDMLIDCIEETSKIKKKQPIS